MTSDIPTESDALVAYSRLGRWTALTLLLALGACAVVVNVFPDGQLSELANRLFLILPIAIVIALAAMRSGLRGARTNAHGGAMKAVLNDELRQQSLNLSYRNGVVAVLLAQPLLAYLLTFASSAYALALMAGATLFTGVVVVLSSLLVYDR